MQDRETIKQINKDIYAIMMPMYNKLIELQSKLPTRDTHSLEYDNIRYAFTDLRRQYEILQSTNKRIITFNSVKEVKSEMLRISSEREELINKYNSIRKQFERAKSVEERNKFVDEARGVAPQIKCYDKLVDIFNKYLNKKEDNEVKDKVDKRKLEELKRKEEEKRRKENENKIRKLSDAPKVEELYKLNLKIKKIKSEIFKLDQNSVNARKLSKVLYDLCDEREKLITDTLGSASINEIAVLESMEDETYSKADTKRIEDYTLNKTEYTSSLMDSIYTLGDLKFNGMEAESYKKYRMNINDETEVESYNKLYETTLRKYKSLIESVIKDDKVLSNMEDDLLISLSSYNLTGGYNQFKKKHKDGKIGGNAISKELYEEGIKKINGLIDSLTKYAYNYIMSHKDKIVIKDNCKTRSELEEEVDNKYMSLYEKVYTLSMENTSKL